MQVLNVGRMAVGTLVNPLKNFACVSHRSAIYVFGGLDAKERASADVQVRYTNTHTHIHTHTHTLTLPGIPCMTATTILCSAIYITSLCN